MEKYIINFIKILDCKVRLHLIITLKRRDPLMKINEVEKLLNVSRANIRFYEKEGLFVPERGTNGYRSYSDMDIKRLKTILMFRKMGFSVSAIKSLIKGDIDMETALNENIDQIKNQINELHGALSLCHEL